MNKWELILQHITPINVLKWATVIFVVVMQVLIIITLVLAIFGVFNAG